jgi:2,4-dienoyl-CoA reductase-like NADH-dependent reductase (Old Yellow Enzyme family)
MNAGEFDLVAVGRALIANPDWARLVRENHTGDIKAFNVEMLGGLN